jgi:hypothetical protein
MSEPRKFPYQDRMVEGVEVEFESKGEQWNYYTLGDGSKLKLKTVMMEVYRLVDEFDTNGNPVYVFTAQQVVGSEANPELIRKPS